MYECKNRTIAFVMIFFSFLVPPLVAADTDLSNPVEAGDVHWNRDLQAMFTFSRESGKPLFVLFQEIPGCIGCRTFGSEVLTQPLLVEAIESEFIPVLVYNNRFGGQDEKILKRFGEPSWNYQVVRFLNSDGEDIIPRKDKVWTRAELALRMVLALERFGRQVPLYLRNLTVEYDSENHGRIGFAMACYWTGEYKLGRIDGVVATETGWYDNREVTLVTYHRKLLTPDQIAIIAAKEKCAQRIYLFPGEQLKPGNLTLTTFDEKKYTRAQQSDQKKQLSLWPQVSEIKNLTPFQLTKLNSFAPDNRRRAIMYLSPRQRIQLSE